MNKWRLEGTRDGKQGGIKAYDHLSPIFDPQDPHEPVLVPSTSDPQGIQLVPVHRCLLFRMVIRLDPHRLSLQSLGIGPSICNLLYFKSKSYLPFSLSPRP